jgi:hypothetical protein
LIKIQKRLTFFKLQRSGGEASTKFSSIWGQLLFLDIFPEQSQEFSKFPQIINPSIEIYLNAFKLYNTHKKQHNYFISTSIWSNFYLNTSKLDKENLLDHTWK